MSSETIEPGFDARGWLRSAGQIARRERIRASALTVADIVPATAFAAGLALSIDALTRHQTATAMGWIALAMASLISRGILARGAADAGIDAAQRIKGQARRAVLAELFSGRRTAGAGISGLRRLLGGRRADPDDGFLKDLFSHALRCAWHRRLVGRPSMASS